MTRAPFIAFEGIEGSGKSTQIQLLSEWLAEAGIPHIATREPGGTEVGERIRDIVLHGVDLVLPDRTELLLILGARAAFVRDVVHPALERGECVLSDRFSWSTLAYQGHGRGLPLEEVRNLDRFATGGLTPDLYVFLDVPVGQGLGRQRRAGMEADRFEGEGPTFLSRVREGYEALLRGPTPSVRVDGTAQPEAVQRQVRETLRGRFPGTFAAASV